jgi:hypothetical protein
VEDEIGKSCNTKGQKEEREGVRERERRWDAYALLVEKPEGKRLIRRRRRWWILLRWFLER